MFAILRGAVICVATISLAGIYGHLTSNGAAGKVLFTIAFAALVRGFKSPGTFLAEREIDYRKVSFYEVGVGFLDATVVIVLARFARC